MDDIVESVECACGLWYLAGNGKKGEDPFLSASYNPDTGKLDMCGGCAPEFKAAQVKHED